MLLHLIAVVVLGLMCGSELNVAAFAHPMLNRLPQETHVLVRSSLARLFGRVMPFWMSGSTLLNLLLLFPFAHLGSQPWRYAMIAFVMQVIAVLFSLVAPVPINNRIAKWTPGSLPADWRSQESRWDAYHWVRTCWLIAAFALLTFSFGIGR